VELYLHSPIRLHGVVLNYARGQLFLLSLYKMLNKKVEFSVCATNRHAMKTYGSAVA
jgi:hypothetical protein